MSRLKVDLHPIFSDGARIEAALQAAFREAGEKRIEELEIIPGKGSGALKKSVLRFLERPEIKRQYHRVVKDSDNWGRLFVYFRWGPRTTERMPAIERVEYACFCCGALNPVEFERVAEDGYVIECPGCGSPNRLELSGGAVRASAGY